VTASLRTSSESVFPTIIPFYLPRRNSPYQTRTSSLSRLHDHTQTHHTRQYYSGRVISPTQRLLPDDTHHSQETDIHASGGIRTLNPSKRAAADVRHRSRGHWDGLHSVVSHLILLPIQRCVTTNTSCYIPVSVAPLYGQMIFVFCGRLRVT
jgi:hypothetical protein